MAPPPVDPLSVARAMMAIVVARATTTTIRRMREAPAAATIVAMMIHVQAVATSVMATSVAVAPINPILLVHLAVALAMSGTSAVGAAAVGVAPTPTQGAWIAQPAIHDRRFAMTGMRDRVVARVAPHPRTPALVADVQAQRPLSHAAAFGTMSQ